MRVLITGGCGFIGSHVAERFVKEGHVVYVIDDLSTGCKAYLKGKHYFYDLNTADKRCQDVFRNNNIDVVVHLAARLCLYVAGNGESVYCQANLTGLTNMLELSQKYGVKKFVYVSSGAVYGDVTGPVDEAAPIKPLSLTGINFAAGESCCERWRESHGLNIAILRLSSVYGPRQCSKCGHGMPASIITSIIDSQDVTIDGNETQTKDYVYVEDAADAIYKVVNSTTHSPVLNVSTNTGTSVRDLLDLLGRFALVGNVVYTEPSGGSLPEPTLSNTRIKAELGWSPKYQLPEGLTITYRYHEQHRSQPKEKPTATRRTVAKFRPYLENFALFMLMGAVSYGNLYGGLMDFWVGLDYNYVYIAIMGLLYGKSQSLPATFLSAILFIYFMMARSADFVTLIYQIQYLIHLATYLFVGVVTGYITDNRERMVVDKAAELDNLQERFNFLQTMYSECIEIKDELYAQIVNSDDSLGKIHSIVRELDSLRLEDIYTAAVSVVIKVMKGKAVDIYTVNKDSSYWRLKVRSDAHACCLPNSIRIADFNYAQEIMTTKEVFVNKSLHANCPGMAAPVVYEGRVIAILQLYDLPFESLNLYNLNLFRVTTMLIAGSLTRAYLHGQEMQEIKYLSGTSLLVPDEFEKVLTAAQKRQQLFKQEAALLQLTDKASDYRQIAAAIAGSIRAEDYAGLRKDGYLYILLLNITSSMVAEVRKRLQNKGIFTVEVVNEQHSN